MSSLKTVAVIDLTVIILAVLKPTGLSLLRKKFQAQRESGLASLDFDVLLNWGFSLFRSLLCFRDSRQPPLIHFSFAAQGFQNIMERMELVRVSNELSQLRCGGFFTATSALQLLCR